MEVLICLAAFGFIGGLARLIAFIEERKDKK